MKKPMRETAVESHPSTDEGHPAFALTENRWQYIPRLVSHLRVASVVAAGVSTIFFTRFTMVLIA
jgi:hypothetical protein